MTLEQKRQYIVESLPNLQEQDLNALVQVIDQSLPEVHEPISAYSLRRIEQGLKSVAEGNFFTVEEVLEDFDRDIADSSE